MNEQKAKEAFDKVKDLDFGGLQQMFNDLSNKIEPTLRRMSEENHKITKPKARKNMNLNGINISLSLIEDGRIMISFPTLDASVKAYDFFDKINWDALEEEKTRSQFYREEGLKTAARLLDTEEALKIEKEKKWYHKLFGK